MYVGIVTGKNKVCWLDRKDSTTYYSICDKYYDKRVVNLISFDQSCNITCDSCRRWHDDIYGSSNSKDFRNTSQNHIMNSGVYYPMTIKKKLIRFRKTIKKIIWKCYAR